MPVMLAKVKILAMQTGVRKFSAAVAKNRNTARKPTKATSSENSASLKRNRVKVTVRDDKDSSPFFTFYV
jgi:hypothetical protein